MAEVHDHDALILQVGRRGISVLYGNKSSIGVLFPDGPSCPESISAFGMIQDGARGIVEPGVLRRIAHKYSSPQYHVHG
jgi:hypothetical protein